MREILRGSAIIFLFKVFGAISLFLVHILISRYYGAETLGVFNLILALMIIGAIFSRVGLDIYVVKIIPSLERKPQQISLFLKEVFKIVLVGSLIVSILFLIFSEYINKYIFKSFDAENYIFYLALITIPFALFNLLPEVLRGFHDIKIYSFFRNVSQNLFLLIVLSISIYFSLNIDPIYSLYSTIFIITIILSIVVYKFLKKHNIYLNEKGRYKEKILKYSYPMFLTSSMMFIMGYVDSFMISYYLNEYQVGIYSACVKLSFIVTFILTSVNGFIAPKISQAYSNKDFNRVKNIYFDSIKLIILFSLPVFSLLYIFPEFFLGLFGEEFKVATTTLLIVNSAYLINALCGPVGYVLNMTSNQHIFMKIILVGLILNILLNILLIPLYGINGASVATLISMAIWNIGSLIVLKKKKIV